MFDSEFLSSIKFLGETIKHWQRSDRLCSPSVNIKQGHITNCWTVISKSSQQSKLFYILLDTKKINKYHIIFFLLLSWRILIVNRIKKKNYVETLFHKHKKTRLCWKMAFYFQVRNKPLSKWSLIHVKWHDINKTADIFPNCWEKRIKQEATTLHSPVGPYSSSHLWMKGLIENEKNRS